MDTVTVSLYHPKPNDRHLRMAQLLSAAWNTSVVVGTEPANAAWKDSGWLDSDRSEEPDSSDVLAWIYWRTWVWERSLPRDAHGRPQGAFSDRNLLVPEAELRALAWGKELGVSQPKMAIAHPVLVVDIDHLFAYRGRGWMSWVGGALVDLFNGRLKALRARLIGPDPFFSLPFWADVAARYPRIDLQFFALLAARTGQYDRGVRSHIQAVRQALRDLHLRFEVGSHLSYGSHERQGGYRSELGTLEGILQAPVVRQRSHFLRNACNETFLESLADLGITEDWSLQFADAAGFRSGWASAIPTAGLLQVPVAIMDQNTLGMEPDEVANLLRELQEASASVGAPLRIGTHWRIFGPWPEAERSGKDFSSWTRGLALWLEDNARES